MKATIQFIVLVCIGSFFTFPILGQSFRQGTVIDKNTKETLPGVQITIKGSLTGTITDIDGNYQLEVGDNQFLLFNMLGYEPLEIKIGNAKIINAELVPVAYDLSEVVVTALGISRETRSLSYSTQNLGKDKIEIRDNSSNLLSSLSGKISGAVITTAATGPGAAARVVLRGNRSISGNNTALIVVDGVPYDNSAPGQATGTMYSYGTSDGAANINPDDIESINILKGPSAAALYGSRAANGAIIITTKKGEEDNFSIDYNGGISIDIPNLLIDYQNTYGRGNGGVFSQTVGESWGEKAVTYPNNVKKFFQTAFSSNNSVSAYGGSKYLKAYSSYTNNYITGVIPNNELNRNTFNLRVNTNFFPKLSTDTKLTYVNQNIKNRPRLGDAGTPLEVYIIPRDMDETELKDFETINPINGEPVRKYWINSSIYDNPYWSIYRTSVNEQRDRVTLLGSIKYQLFEWLSLMGRVSYDQYNDKTIGAFYDGTVSLGDVKTGGKYFERQAQYRERNFDILLSGQNTIIPDNLGIGYNLGASSLRRNYAVVENMANGLSIPNHFTLSAATTPSFNVDGYERVLNSVYGNFQVDFKRYLFLDVTGRNDWSSTLPSPHSYFYPSIGLSAVISDMITLPQWISFGKVRVSYTQVGNDPEPYLLNQRYRFALGAGKGFIFRESDKSISDLRPEKTKSVEVGLDWRFLNNRLNVDITTYKSNTINQLLYVGLPMASGFSRRYINAGNIENKGIEVQLETKPIIRKVFAWNSSVNFSTNKNTVIELAPNTTQTNISDNTKYATVIVKEGSAYGDLYGRKWKIDENSGKYIVDNNGLPIVENNQYLGNFNPDFMLGWTNSFSYKQLRISFLIDAKIGGEMVSGTDAYLAAYGLSKYTENFRDGGLVLDAVKQDGTVNTTIITAQQLWTRVSLNGRDAWGDFFTYDMTNIRFREFSVAYNFALKSELVKSAQIAFTGRNLFFFYRGKAKLDIPGIDKRLMPSDPDATLGAGNYQGVELGLPPVSRSFGLNVKLTF